MAERINKTEAVPKMGRDTFIVSTSGTLNLFIPFILHTLLTSLSHFTVGHLRSLYTISYIPFCTSVPFRPERLTSLIPICYKPFCLPRCPVPKMGRLHFSAQIQIQCQINQLTQQFSPLLGEMSAGQRGPNHDLQTHPRPHPKKIHLSLLQ